MSTVDRFSARFRKDPSGCWVWTAGVSSNGYGALKVAAKQCGAHRVSWEIHFGAIPENLCVCHKCDNRLCVNPDHLFLGTKADNAADRAAKGRNWFQPKGERHYLARLTQAAADSIRLEYANGGISQRALAAKWGVTQATVLKVIHKRTYACA